MASEKASVQISLDGADAVVSDAKKAEQAINSIGSGAVRAGKAVAGSMAGAVGSAMQLAAAATAINFGKGMSDAKQLDLTVARLARTAGASGDALKASFEKAERSTLTSSLALADFSKALGRTTYDGKYAAGAEANLHHRKHYQKAFFDLLDEKCGDPELPDWLADNWHMIGNAVHRVIGCSCVYLVSCKERSGETRYIKVGKARDVKERMHGLAIGCPLKLQKALYFCVIGDEKAFDLERKIHSEFAKYRINGEWFQFDDKEAMERVAGEMVDFVRGILGDSFRMFTHDSWLDDHQHMPAIRGFIHALWRKAEIEARTQLLEDTPPQGTRPDLF